MPDDIETRVKKVEEYIVFSKLQQITNPLDYVSRQIIREEINKSIEEKLGTGFGGDGSDGELSISSGTTTLDLNSAPIFVRNYSNISITGSGKLAFSNPHANGTIVVLKSSNNVTLTATAPCINLTGIGGAGGAGGTGDGSIGSNGHSIYLTAVMNGGNYGLQTQAGGAA